MSEFLVIRIDGSQPQLAHWIAVDSSGARRSQPCVGTLQEAAADISDRQVIVLVPSTDVLTTSVDIPVKGAKLLAALPFALEEHLAEDIEDLHFAAGARRSSGRTPVSVVSHERMEEWLSALRFAGIHPHSVVAENYGLARIPGTISMLVSGDLVFINDGANVELVMQGVSPGDALAAIGALDDGGGKEAGDASAMPRHVLVYCDAGDDERYQHDWIAIRHELDSVDVKLLPDGVTPRLAVTVATGAGINLLQGRYAPRKEYSGLFRPWKYAAVLALAFGVVGVGAKGLSFYVLSKQEAELKALFNSEYRQMLPGAPETDDPAAVIDSLRRRIGNVETPPVFLQSMEQLSRAIRQNSSASIQAISFRAGIIDLRVSAPDVATLDGVQRAIGESGQFQASIQSTDQDGDKVSSRMQIQVAGS
ncbi:MAG: type II secretion system protein GspL [Gammaproteobacteria bacterium]|nr:type II secretion system protein GspL [Gammaproteobacteria bacterium]MDH5344866.1 type II secretion system protein GspL [Gammaproteobacteria bacterium]